MKLNVFHKISGLLFAAWLASQAQAANAQALTAEQLTVIGLAGELYPDLFLVGGDVKSAQGYTYMTFSSGVSVGFKDGALYVAGGPYGATPRNMGTVAQVQAQLQTLKSSVSVQPSTDMTSLLTLAAQAYPTLFSGTGSEFRTTADGYLYRYFANTGIYAAFKNGNVYVKGGSFGNAYTSVGALNSLLSALDVKVNGSTPVIPSGNYNLTVSGTVTISGPIAISQPFSYTINGIPAPNVSDQAAIKSAFSDSLTGQSANGITITNFSYTTISNTANLVEFDVSVSATINTSGLNTGYTYSLKYKYTK
jgi:hypothetical protein